MTNLNGIKETIEKAWEVKNGATGVYRAFREAASEEEVKVTGNKHLSQEGREAMLGKLRERKTVEAMKLAQSQIGLYNKYLDDARKEADKIAYAKLPAVDPVKEQRFDKAFAELKTQIMLASPEKAAQLLKEFVDATEDQALVDKIRADFASTIQPVIGTADHKIKASLTDLFEHTKFKARGAESVEASRLIEQIDSMRHGRFFPQIVEDNARSLGKQAAMYINRPDEYFAVFPEHEKMKTDMRTMEEVLLEASYEV